MERPHVLCVNPWIHDFAAYDVWASPLGLLTLASLLRDHGISVSYINCLDRFHPESDKPGKEKQDGRGAYLKTEIPSPSGLSDVDRKFSRYGIKPSWFRKDLHAIKKPDLICVTSLMTYWAPGVRETIQIIKDVFPDVPVVLGGIYASLCYDHALRNSGADKVISGHGELKIFDAVREHTGFNPGLTFDINNLDSYPYPAYDLARKISHIPLLSSRGCPYSCRYCASNFLDPVRRRRSPESVVKEISYWNHDYGVINFAFYDDAFLVGSGDHAIPLMKKIIRLGLHVNFHTPNALHIREITKEIASLMYDSGFKTIRLGLETTSFETRKGIDSKVNREEFDKAVRNLLDAGFKKEQIGAYLLAGMPGQTREAVEESYRTAHDCGITPVLAYYTPIPKTPMWNEAVRSSRYDLEKDPVFKNNEVFTCSKKTFSWDMESYFKKLKKNMTAS